MFPKIEHLDDVAPHVSFDAGFVVSRRPNHTVLDYVYTVDGMFDTAIARECRGLKFDAEGRLIGRPFHKFFNIGEKERPEDIDWSTRHDVLEKLDGSMVHPVLLGNEMPFMTRMGVTGQAETARSKADAGVLDLSVHLLGASLTPIFEFTAPDNRIVVRYDKPSLTLLAVREMRNGNYLPFSELDTLGQRFSVPVAKRHNPVDDFKSFIEQSRALEGIEGFVIAFENGHRLKLKTDGYVLRHRALANIAQEKNALELVATEGLDDVLPLLPEKTAAFLVSYRDTVLAGVARRTKEIESFLAEHSAMDRRDIAAKVRSELDKRLSAATFAALDGKPVAPSLMNLLQREAKTNERTKGLHDLFGMDWDPEALDLPFLEN